MSGFKAKHQALQILQRLASGEKLPGKERNPTFSPRKPGIRNSDDILKEKYNELAELVALQRLEKQAVSSLQKMYVSPPKGERRSRRRRRDGETRTKRKEDNERKESKKQRPMSASSTSSYSSSASFTSRASSMSNSSRSSSMSSRSNVSRSSASSNTSRASTMSNSSRSSTRSKSSSTPKPVERHFVTIVEEEEEEEVVNQDDIKERQVVQFDKDLAQENKEEAERKKEASKRRRQVSFVLETQEKSSDDDDDMDDEEENVPDEDERYVPGEESSSPSRSQDYDRRHNTGDPTPRYIEIEDSILREILSPRSPRRGFKLSQNSEDRSPFRDRSKSPQRKARSPSPKRAWEVPNTLPLPPRPVKDIKPCDHKLSNTDNPEIKKWLRHKNALIRRERKAELQKEREKQRAAEASSQKRVERLVESEEFYDTWVKQKKKDLRRKHRDERRLAKEERRRQEEERARREKLFQEKINMSVSSFGERVPTPRKEKQIRKQSGKSIGEDNSPKTKLNIRKAKDKGSEIDGQQRFPSSNPFKGVTYDEWMKQKMKQDEINKKKERQKKKIDPDLEDIIPQVAKERIERAKSGKGRRVSSALGKEKDERPECDRAATEKTDAPKPYRWSNDSTSTSDKHSKQSSAHGKGGLHRPSTAKNHLRNAPHQERVPSTNPGKVHGPRVFSPSFARPEPQGSESNDDHSEHNGNKGKPILHRNTAGKNDKVGNQNEEGLVWEKALVKANPAQPVADPEDLSIFLTEFDG
ncbi:serine/arginine repetitive matrix protein 1-like [Lytechinus variegatus]|uniref:serine/arginine repetitive matrix protein 1-like n=1 Tax=Lytechinus variegatus TaxID=7654 RepID=UPI001BB2C7BA|nr:serine/arginine repetitive matrix protein 1-like [Lytechinus variegatus]